VSGDSSTFHIVESSASAEGATAMGAEKEPVA
jgi:hypothetical protein